MIHPPSSRNVSPQFCPRCDRATPDGAFLCPDCGDRVETQGYCPVCDKTWRLAIGFPCPKHDLPLLAEGPTPHPSQISGEVVDWVTVATFSSPTEAEVRRIRLEGEGIPTFLDGERMATNVIYGSTIIGLKLQVPRPLAAEARILLDQSWSLPPVVEDFDDAWDELAPKPAADLNSTTGGVALLLPLIVLAIAVCLVVSRF